MIGETNHKDDTGIQSVKDLFVLFPDDEEPESLAGNECTGTFVRGRFFVIHPHSYVSIGWNTLVAIVTICVAIELPIEMAWFSTPGDEAEHTLIIISWVVVLVFAADMLVEMNTAAMLDSGVFLTRRGPILLNYLRTWFLIDFVSTVPWDALVQGNAWQLLRLTKLLRLGRVFQSMVRPDTLKHVEENHPLPYDAIDLTKFFLALLLTCHLMSCGLYMLVDDYAGEIIGNEGFLAANDLQQASIAAQYLTGIYWASYTLSTIGYGDIALVTYSQRGYAIICMLVGASVYAYMVGSVIGMLQNMNATEQERRRQVQSVNNLMGRVYLPATEQHRVRCYFSRTSASNIKQLSEEEMILMKLSPPLAAVITRHMHRRWLPHIWWLNTDDDVFTVRFALMIVEQSFFPGEYLFKRGNSASALFILRKGTTLRQDTEGGEKFACSITEGKNSLFGKEAILRTNRYYSYDCMAKTICDVWRIDRHCFMQLLDEFPRLRARVRWETFLMLLRRFPGGVKALREAKEKLEEEEAVQEKSQQEIALLAAALTNNPKGFSERLMVGPSRLEEVVRNTMSTLAPQN